MTDCPPKRILVADDEPDILRPTAVRLRKAGYEVLTAGDGEEALSAARRNPPDLCLLDYHMPRLQGRELVLRLREAVAPRPLPVILMTASADQTSPENLSELGAQDFLLKPFEAADLMGKVERLVGGDRLSP